MKNNFTAMTAEMSSFVFKFKSLLLAGLNAKLVMECEDGVVRAHVEAVLGPAGVAQAGRHHHHQGRAGPARLRRRARRAEAIANARRQASKPHADPPNDVIDGGPPNERGVGPPHPPAASAGHGGYQDERGAGPPHPRAARAGHGGHQDVRGAGPPHPPATSAVHLPRIAASTEREAAHQTLPPTVVPPLPAPPPPCDSSTPPQPYVPHPRQSADPLRLEDQGDIAHSHPRVPLTLSFSAVAARGSSKTVFRAPDWPRGSPGGWGATDPTRSENENGSDIESENGSDSDEELSTPQMLYVWHTPSPVRQLLTGQRPMCSTPNPHAPQPPQQQPIPDLRQPNHAPASLNHVIQYLHNRAQNPYLAFPRKKREYGGGYYLEKTSAGVIRHELTSKRQLARRGGYWDMLGEDFYIDSDQESDGELDDDQTEENVT